MVYTRGTQNLKNSHIRKKRKCKSEGSMGISIEELKVRVKGTHKTQSSIFELSMSNGKINTK